MTICGAGEIHKSARARKISGRRDAKEAIAKIRDYSQCTVFYMKLNDSMLDIYKYFVKCIVHLGSLFSQYGHFKSIRMILACRVSHSKVTKRRERFNKKVKEAR